MKRNPKQLPTRACGECSACCVSLPIKEFDKPAGVPCVHLAGECLGCTVYESRPDVCRGFICTWQYGDPILKASERPDRLGVIFHSDHTGGAPTFYATEVRDGALETPRVREIIETAKASGKVERLVQIRRRDQERTLWQRGGFTLAQLAMWREHQATRKGGDNGDE